MELVTPTDVAEAREGAWTRCPPPPPLPPSPPPPPPPLLCLCVWTPGLRSPGLQEAPRSRDSQVHQAGAGMEDIDLGQTQHVLWSKGPVSPRWCWDIGTGTGGVSLSAPHRIFFSFVPEIAKVGPERDSSSPAWTLRVSSSTPPWLSSFLITRPPLLSFTASPPPLFGRVPTRFFYYLSTPASC